MTKEDRVRLALHAAVLAFPHPRTGALLRFEAPLPADLQRLLTCLRALPRQEPPQAPGQG